MTAVHPLHLALALALLAVAAAQDRKFPTDEWFTKHVDTNPIRFEASSPRLSRRVKQGETTGFCVCSATARGYPKLTDPLVLKVTQLLDQLAKLKPTSREIASLRNALETAIKNLQTKVAMEGFVNLDAKLRASGKPGYCLVDKKTGRSMFPLEDSEARASGTRDFVSMKGCDQSPELEASPQVRKAFVTAPGADPAPGPGEVPPLNTAGGKEGAGKQGAGKQGAGKKGAESPPPTKGPAGDSSAPPPTAGGGLGASSANDTDVPPPTVAVDEGCVAVEHLGSHPVQHRMPQLKLVLCGRGFCATPNHALIVDGMWTSMKKLCAAGWKCSVEMRFVNNLKISAGTRLRFDEHIVITPYDDRFWVALPWLIQMAQDAVALVVIALQVAAVLSVALLARAAVTVVQREPRVSGKAAEGSHRVWKIVGDAARSVKRCQL